MRPPILNALSPIKVNPSPNNDTNFVALSRIGSKGVIPSTTPKAMSIRGRNTALTFVII